MKLWTWLKKLDRVILDWLISMQVRQVPQGRFGRHRTPDGMLSTAQTLRQLQGSWGYESPRYVR